MSHPNPVKHAWADGRPVRNCWLSLSDPTVVEILAAQDFDALTIDLQHGVYDRRSATTAIQIILAHGKVPFVRLADGSAAMINAMLDAGALGLICPLVESAQEAAAFVSPCRYPPEGSRSYGSLLATLRHGPEYFRKSSDLIICLAMIETRAGFEAVDAIAATPGLDGVFIGPADLSLALGGLPAADVTDDSSMAAYGRILNAAKSAGKACAIYNRSPAYGARMAAMGFDMVNLAADAALLIGGAMASSQAFEAELSTAEV